MEYVSQEHNEQDYRSRVSPGKNWTEIVSLVGDLPPLPNVASRALVMIEDPDTSAVQLTKLLGTDAALAARVLKIANSAMFACQRKITTLNQAIMIIGFKTLKGLIMAATLRQLNRKTGHVEKMLWENSIGTATAAYIISQHLRKNYSDEAFLLGLLHDLGKLVLVRQIPNEYLPVARATQNGQSFVEAEQAALGFAHPLIGALVAKKWNFSSETCQVILHHHDPVDVNSDDPADEKTVIIQLADYTSHMLGFGHLDGYPDMTDSAITLATQLGISDADFLRLQERITQSVEDQRSALS